MKDIELIDHTLQRIAQYGDGEIEISTKHLEKICKLALEHLIEQSHKQVVMQTLPFSFVEWYSGMQKEKIESAYQRWMKEGNVAVGERSVDTNAEVVDCSNDKHFWSSNKKGIQECLFCPARREAPSGGHL